MKTTEYNLIKVVINSENNENKKDSKEENEVKKTFIEKFKSKWKSIIKIVNLDFFNKEKKE